jgi:hypothetical protein
VNGRSITPTFTPFQPVPFTLTPAPTATATPQPHPAVWAAPETPAGLKASTILPEGWVWAERAEQASLQLRISQSGTPWVYVLAAPFATLSDEVSLEALQRAWRGERLEAAGGQPLLMETDTLNSYKQQWGEPAAGAVLEAAREEISAKAWQMHAFALIGFDELDPSWKVMRIDGKSPLDRGELSAYPLTAAYGLAGDPAEIASFSAQGGRLGSTNRDPGHMTTLLMTGTTALVRAVGYKMETRGMTYPGGDISTWLKDADFTHLSNESSFNPACPDADPNSKSYMFCSKPEYIQLFDAVGANIIELSGNHNNDWGREAFTYTLDLFRQRDWQWFAGGENAEEARKALLIEHNGNKLALIGCNYAGPPGVWATRDEPGAAHCDLDWLDQELPRLKEQGYLPVITFQYNEIYQMKPSEGQARDFRRAAQAGAVIVQGSQAHFPQIYELRDGTFIHYGLGNLFFDQMDTPVDGTRRELLDLHVFYGNKHISTVVLTAMLEDYARPRPMSAEERQTFLNDLFRAAGW